MSIKTASVNVFRKAQKDHAPRLNPFPGARPFRTDESRSFYGRAREVPELAALVRAQRLCLLFAPSGAGKSSLINAGLLQKASVEGSGRPSAGIGDLDVVGIAKVHPGAVRGPDGWPDAAKVPNVYVTAALNSLVGHDRSTHTTLAGYLKSRPAMLDEFDDPIPRLLVLDQFEEILEPFGRSDWLRCREDFFTQLDTVMRDDPSLHVLVSIREDHLATIERLTAKMRVPFQARYRLDKLTTRSARQAIEGPAHASGLPFEAGVADTLVDDLARRRIDEFKEPIPDEFVEPGQLQVVCNRIWARADADPSNREPGVAAAIRGDHVKETGGVEGALRRYYDEAVRSVTNGHKERRLRRFFERRLITTRFTRQLVPVDPASSTTDRIPNAVLERLESEYGLVRKEQRGGTSYWELSHDGFVQPIRKANFEVWDHRRKKVAGITWGLVTVAVVLTVAWQGLTSNDGDDRPSTVGQFVVPVMANGEGLAPVSIGRFEGGVSVVVELVQPPKSTATFVLQAVGGSAVAPQASQGDLAEYTIPYTAELEVVVSGDGAPPALGVTVRPGATVVALPDVLGTNSTSAEEDLTNAGLFVTSIRAACSDGPGLSTGDTLRVIDVDRQFVRGVNGVLVDIGTVPTPPVAVATGTTAGLVAFSGEPCRAETAPTPSRPD